MRIDESTLKNIEKLAKLKVSEEDKAITLKKIASVLDNMDKVDMAEIADLEPLYHPLEINQPMRNDILITQALFYQLVMRWQKHKPNRQIFCYQKRKIVPYWVCQLFTKIILTSKIIRRLVRQKCLKIIFQFMMRPLLI